MRSSTTSTGPTVPVILAEIVGAVIGAVIAGPIFYFVVGYGFLWANMGMGLLALQLFGVIIGGGIGAGLGVAAAGRLVGQAGSTWGAVIAAVLAAVIVILGMRLLNIGGLGGLLVAGVVAVIAAAVAGYNLRRR
jgi:hypothetical protein